MSAENCGCDLDAKIRHRCARHQEEFDTQSSRTFQHTIYTVEVVTEEGVPLPTPFTEIEGVIPVFVSTDHHTIDAVTAVKLLKVVGENPRQLSLTPSGKDYEETDGD